VSGKNLPARDNRRSRGACGVQEDVGTPIVDQIDADTIADRQSRLSDLEAELARTRMQRDYILRLLRQQQTIGTAYIQNRALEFRLGQQGLLARLIRRAPPSIKNMVPTSVKQALKKIIVKIA
jgi:hypothetical protein